MRGICTQRSTKICRNECKNYGWTHIIVSVDIKKCSVSLILIHISVKIVFYTLIQINE